MELQCICTAILIVCSIDLYPKYVYTEPHMMVPMHEKNYRSI